MAFIGTIQKIQPWPLWLKSDSALDERKGVLGVYLMVCMLFFCLLTTIFTWYGDDTNVFAIGNNPAEMGNIVNNELVKIIKMVES